MERKPEQVFDELLIHRYRGGDRQAMDLLIRRWHEKLKRHITRHTYEQEVAEDLAQEVWEVVLKGIYNLRQPALFGIWAFRIASRKAVDWIRANQRKRKLEGELKYASEGEESEDDRLIVLQRALKELPESQRMILMLYYLERQQVAEISSILEIPPGTVKSRLFHARKQLKEVINKVYHEDR